jgi:hypothetical protein
VFLPLCRARERLDFPVKDDLFEIQWRESTRKDLRAIPAHEVERIVAAVEKLSDETVPVRVSEAYGSSSHTTQERCQEEINREFACPGCSNIEATASKQSDGKFQQKKKLFIDEIVDIHSN